jgi:hypothetical protein
MAKGGAAVCDLQGKVETLSTDLQRGMSGKSDALNVWCSGYWIADLPRAY